MATTLNDIRCSSSELGRLIQSMMEVCLNSEPDEADAVNEAISEVHVLRWDNMGLDMVYYWPNVPYTESDDT